MGRINIVLPDELEHKLRVAIVQAGGKKGDLSGSIEDAIKEWLEKVDRAERHTKKK
jgi:Arc/MetJ-type ribon-helix-helix transcriptional regulator